MIHPKDLRIAWLLTSAFYYWHPPLAYLAKLFPKTTAFVANWRGYAPGFEESFLIDIVGERKVIPILKEGTSYGTYFTYLPLNIVNRLFRFKPHVIFANSFGVWTILALLFKPFGRWRVVIAYEGSSPGVDYRNSSVRLGMRRSMVKAADACITNSQAGSAYLTEVLDAKPSHVFVHPYEVPDSSAMMGAIAAQTEHSPQYQRPIFVFIGSINTRKGINFLLDACLLLKNQGREDYTILLVGDGEQQEELQAFCREKDLGDRIQWIGRVAYGELGNYLNQSDVFVLPTLEDTWGMVVLEAMVLGKPVLCSQWAGTAELVVDGENGYRFDPHTPQQLAELMEKFIVDPSLAATMGANAKAVMAQYTPEAAAQFLSKVTSFVLEQ